jgi:hypothetical protein
MSWRSNCIEIVTELPNDRCLGSWDTTDCCSCCLTMVSLCIVLVVNGRRDVSVESTADKIGEDLCLDTGDTRGRMCFKAHVFVD